MCVIKQGPATYFGSWWLNYCQPPISVKFPFEDDRWAELLYCQPTSRNDDMLMHFDSQPITELPPLVGDCLLQLGYRSAMPKAACDTSCKPQSRETHRLFCCDRRTIDFSLR